MSYRSKNPHDSKAVLSFQPKPELTRVIYFQVMGQIVTAIMRHWKRGDSGPNGRCRLCEKCSAYEQGCLFIAKGVVPRGDSAAFFSTIGKRITRGRDVSRNLVVEGFEESLGAGENLVDAILPQDVFALADFVSLGSTE